MNEAHYLTWEAEQRKRRKVQLALAAAVVALLLGGAFAWWRNEQAQLVRQHEVRNADALVALLDQAEEALKADDAAKAHVALEAARKRSAEAVAEEQAERLGRLDADLALLRDLDAIDQFRWTLAENKFPSPTVVAMRTWEALGRFGANPEKVSLDKAAARVSASVLRERIVSALDLLLRQEKAVGVRALLRRVDAEAFRDAVRDALLAEDRGKFVALVGHKEALEQPFGFTAFLGESQAIPVERRRQLLLKTVSQRPGNLGLLMTLGHSYPIKEKETAEARLRWFQAAVVAAPANASAHTNLGVALKDKGKVDEAIACYHKAIALEPKFAAAHTNLGKALESKGKVDEAIACYHKAITLDPKHAPVHNDLGGALESKGKVDEAIACYHKAIALEPKFALAHYALGWALRGKGKVDEAVACYRKTIALEPNYTLAHSNLGAILCDVKRDYDGAIDCFRKAIALEPNYTDAHFNLGVALYGKGEVDEAVACWRKVIVLDPTYPRAHSNLGNALASKGDLEGAIAEFKEALRLDPKERDALAKLPRAQHLHALQSRLPDVLAGKDEPNSPAEACEFADLCAQPAHKRFAESVRLYSDAFRADVKLADDLQAAHRYDAACSAALAATGQGKDAATLDEKEKARLRKQALDWLNADLAQYAKLLQSGSLLVRRFVTQRMQHWQQDADLAGIHGKVALAKLPAQEQKALTQLWADVAELLKKAETPAKKEDKR